MDRKNSASKRSRLNHDSKGRFVKGNPGGPGNPLAKNVNQLRVALLEAITPEDIRKIARKLIRLALKGVPWAVRELFDRTLGKPIEADFLERLADLENKLQNHEEP